MRIRRDILTGLEKITGDGKKYPNPTNLVNHVMSMYLDANRKGVMNPEDLIQIVARFPDPKKALLHCVEVYVKDLEMNFGSN